MKETFSTKDIPGLIALLQQGQVTTVEAALRELAVVNSDSQTAAVKAGGEPAFVEQAREGSVEEKHCGAQVLPKGSGGYSQHEDIRDGGEGVAALVELLQDGSETDKDVVAGALWELSKNLDNRAPITEAGGVPPLVELVFAGNSKQREAAAGALQELASIPKNQVSIAALGGLRALVQLLRNGDAREKAAAAGALRALAVNAVNRTAICALGGLRDLLTLLRDSNAALKETVTGALRSLSLDSTIQREIAALGGIEALVTSIRDGSATEKENATGAMWNLTYKVTANQSKFVRCDGIQPLADLVSHGTASQAVLAAGVLGFLHEHLNSDIADAISRGSKALLVSIESQKSARKVDESLVALLGLCSADIAAVRTGVAELDVHGILSTLFRSGNEVTRNMSARLHVSINGVAAVQPQLCSSMGEAEPLCQHVVDRLQTLVNRGLLAESDTIRHQLNAILSMHGNKSTVARLVSAHALAEAIADLHRKLDTLETERSKNLWKPRWEADLAVMKRQLFECDVSRMGNDLHDTNTQMEALGLLSHEVKQNKASYSKEERAFMRRTTNFIMGFSKLEGPAHEPWFIPRHEIQLQDEHFARGGFGLVYKGKYKNSDVIVKNVKADLNDFLREVAVWHKAGSFPNVVPFFGACHIGSPLMMVCKYISGGSLPHYLYKQQKMGRSRVWHVLLGVTHALQFLQSKGIVHGDLKADNILVDGDMAMLTDFGMSFFVSEGQPRFEKVGAIYWRAPEMALHGKASFESDVYSLGTCILEAVTGDIPWQGIPESAVRSHLRQGKLFRKPRTMQKEVWELVVGMCMFEPLERLSLNQVEERVGNFADQELEAEYERQGLVNEKEVILVSDLSDLCSTMEEAGPLYRHVLERLRRLFERKVESIGLMLCDFKSLMKQNEGKVAVLRLVSAHAVASALQALHREIDEFEPPGARDLWEEVWQIERAAMKKNLFSCEVAQLMRDVDSANAQEVLVLLNHEVEDIESYSEEERQLLKSLANAIAQSLQTEIPREEKWFIPRAEVQLSDYPFNRGSFGKIFHGTYMNTRVAVKCIDIRSEKDRESFLREVSVWHEASRHPNIVPFFGACHVGDPCFMVCKYIDGGPLPEYLYRQQKNGRPCAWRALLGATHAVQFLHSKDIIHGDLKGNNILMEGDTAMLTDFGESFFRLDAQPEHWGAMRWRAPEVIATNKASFEADVYSLGMCVIEALTGELPWGRVDDMLVKYWVKNNKFLRQPKTMSDDEWALVCAMCDFDPSKRMKLPEVEKRIREFAEIEEETAWMKATQAAS